MRLLLISLALCASVVSSPSAAQGSAQTADVVLIPQSVFDGERLQSGWAVVVRGERMVAAGPVASVQRPGSREVRLAGLTLMPGMIEGHSHLLLHPYNEVTWNDQVLREPVSYRVARAVTHGERTLMAGVTTVRDLGTETHFEYGSRAGVWRLARLFDRYRIPVTVSACAVALERNPAVVDWMKAQGHDLLGHGLRWAEYSTVDREQEDRELHEAIALYEKLAGQRPLGAVSVAKKPITNDPLTLTTSVPHGNAAPAIRVTVSALANRATLPSAPPRAIQR